MNLMRTLMTTVVGIKLRNFLKKRIQKDITDN